MSQEEKNIPVEQQRLEKEQIEDMGSVYRTRGAHAIHCLTVIGQVEGHVEAPQGQKTTKYEHVIPQLVAVQEDPAIEGLLVLLNTVGGDVEAGLALAELIASISHDIRTPLTAIRAYIEGLLDHVADTPEKRDKYIKTIYNKANEMDLLLNELTLYSKIDTNRIPYNFSKINVMEYFDDCVEEIGLDLEAKNIGLSYFNYAGDDVQIIADPEQLKRVIHNIINNSIKYLDKPKGFINIRVKDVGDFIQVEIEDNGKGIAAKDLPYIFDRFYRTDVSRNSSKGGSGIGLSIVKKIMEDHGGKVWATSRLGIGTIMYFVLRKYQEVPMNE